jgi:hypothetical protein
MILIRNAKVLRLGIPASMFGLYQPEVHEQALAQERRMSLSQDEVRCSGIMEIITEVFGELRKEYLEGPLPTDTYRPLLESEVYERAVSKILDGSRHLKDDKAESSMDYKEVVDILRPYATAIRSEEYHWGTVVYIKLQELLVQVNSDDNRVMIVKDYGRNILVYEDTSYLRPILLLDASSDLLLDKIQKLLLEIKSFLHAQEIYLNYAGRVADTMISQYKGQSRVSHKGNRTTLHFYLSDTEKAVITFFQEQMPWTLPDPPTDPESLRKTCQEEESPYFIVALSKKDRKALKSVS